MIRVRVSSTYCLAKQDYIEYVTVNRAHIIYTGIIKQAMGEYHEVEATEEQIVEYMAYGCPDSDMQFLF